jgi:hypothetical protein
MYVEMNPVYVKLCTMDIHICTICDTQNMYIIVWICEATVAYMQKMLQGLSWICQMQTWSSSPMICIGNKTSTK